MVLLSDHFYDVLCFCHRPKEQCTFVCVNLLRVNFVRLVLSVFDDCVSLWDRRFISLTCIICMFMYERNTLPYFCGVRLLECQRPLLEYLLWNTSCRSTANMNNVVGFRGICWHHNSTCYGAVYNVAIEVNNKYSGVGTHDLYIILSTAPIATKASHTAIYVPT